MGTIFGGCASPERSVRWAELSRKGVAVGGQYTMASQKKRQNPYEIELPQPIIDSFAQFLVPEIQKLYASEEGAEGTGSMEKEVF